jgi:hypothetical protein
MLTCRRQVDEDTLEWLDENSTAILNLIAEVDSNLYSTAFVGTEEVRRVFFVAPMTAWSGGERIRIPLPSRRGGAGRHVHPCVQCTAWRSSSEVSTLSVFPVSDRHLFWRNALPPPYTRTPHFDRPRTCSEHRVRQRSTSASSSMQSSTRSLLAWPSRKGSHFPPSHHQILLAACFQSAGADERVEKEGGGCDGF